MVGRSDIARGSVELASVKCITRELCVNLYAWRKGHTALKMKYQAGQRQNDGLVDVPQGKQSPRSEQSW
jgi:hypothetical protein